MSSHGQQKKKLRKEAERTGLVTFKYAKIEEQG